MNCSPRYCVQYNLGAQYSNEGRLYKAELYYKDYARLALEETAADTGTAVLTSNGYGHSKGIDLFFVTVPCSGIWNISCLIPIIYPNVNIRNTRN